MNDSISIDQLSNPLGNVTIEESNLSNSTAATKYTSRIIFKVSILLLLFFTLHINTEWWNMLIGDTVKNKSCNCRDLFTFFHKPIHLMPILFHFPHIDCFVQYHVRVWHDRKQSGVHSSTKTTSKHGKQDWSNKCTYDGASSYNCRYFRFLCFNSWKLNSKPEHWNSILI